MPDLKLIALDAEDLSIVSAHLQDAVARVGELAYLPREKRFVAIVNRFDWEQALGDAAGSGRAAKIDQSFERRRAALRFERVNQAKVSGLNLQDKSTALALLAISFAPAEGEGRADGDVTLTFSGGAAIRLTVECIEAELKDLGAAWAAKRSPQHPDDNG